MILREQKNVETNYNYQAREIIIAKIKISVVKTPSSLSVVKISLKCSTSRSPGT